MLCCSCPALALWKQAEQLPAELTCLREDSKWPMNNTLLMCSYFAAAFLQLGRENQAEQLLAELASAISTHSGVVSSCVDYLCYCGSTEYTAAVSVVCSWTVRSRQSSCKQS